METDRYIEICSKDVLDKYLCFNNCKKPLWILYSIAIIIGIYGVYLRTSYGEQELVNHDFMNKKVIDIPFFENCCSWWPISHFILFAILGFFFPNCWKLLFLVGVMWEIIEVLIGKLFIGKDWQRQAFRNDQNIEYSNNWWAGSFKDIIMNSGGLAFGILLSKLVK